MTVDELPQNNNDIVNKQYVDREIFNKVSSQSVIDKVGRDGLYSYVNGSQGIVKVNHYPFQYWLDASGYDFNNVTIASHRDGLYNYYLLDPSFFVPSYSWTTTSIPPDSFADVFFMRYTPVTIGNYVKVEFDFDWNWDITQTYKTIIWRRDYGSTQTYRDLNTKLTKITSFIGNQPQNLMGIFEVNALTEQEIIVTIENFTSSTVSQPELLSLADGLSNNMLDY